MLRVSARRPADWLCFAQFRSQIGILLHRTSRMRAVFPADYLLIDHFRYPRHAISSCLLAPVFCILPLTHSISSNPAALNTNRITVRSQAPKERERISRPVQRHVREPSSLTRRNSIFTVPSRGSKSCG